MNGQCMPNVRLSFQIVSNLTAERSLRLICLSWLQKLPIDLYDRNLMRAS